MKKMMFMGVAAVVLTGCMETGSGIRSASLPACGGVGAVVGGLLLRKSSTGARIAAGALSAVACKVMLDAWANHLDEKDRDRLAEASVKAATTGEDASFSNSTNGVQAKVKVVEVQPSKTVSTNVVILKDRVTETPPIELLQVNYEATSRANIRGGPGTDYKTVGALASADVRKVIGKVQNKDWFLIDEGGAGSGYVFSSLMTPTDRAAPSMTVQGPTSNAQVSAQLSCKIVQQDVTTKNGESVTKTMKLCQQSDGSWEFDTIQNA